MKLEAIKGRGEGEGTALKVHSSKKSVSVAFVKTEDDKVPEKLP